MSGSKHFLHALCHRAWAIPLGLLGAAIVVNFTSPLQAALEIHGPRLHDNGGIGYGPGPQAGMFNEPQFNDMGGARTLQKVTLEVRIDSSGGSSEFDNQFTSGGMVTLAIGSFVDVMGPDPILGAPLVANADAVETSSGSVAATEGEIPANFSGPDYFGPLIGTASTDTDSDFYTTAPELAPYIGAGMVIFDWDGGRSLTGEMLTPAGTRRVDFHSTHNFTFTTTLTYEYVPEPSGLALLVSGGIPLLVRRRACARPAAS